jgi:hypothetical protein
MRVVLTNTSGSIQAIAIEAGTSNAVFHVYAHLLTHVPLALASLDACFNDVLALDSQQL